MVNYLHMSHWILFVIFISVASQAFAAVTAQVDRYNINMDDSINLSIEVSGDDSGEPDLAPLKADFDIVSRNQSSSYSLINGSMSSKKTWFLTLRPRHAGALVIPALTAGNKKTSPITIQVSQVAVRQQPSSGTPQGDIWIDMSAEPSTVYVQQQAIITLRIYQAINLNQAQLSEPVSDHAIVMRLGEDKNYQINRDGRNWAVTERRYVIFPQQHGTLKLEPVQLDGTALARRSYGSPFQSTQPIHARSNSLELSVKAIPSNWHASTWLPAKKIELLEDWPSGEFQVGDSITRTLTLRANGLSASQLPELNPELTTLLPDHLKAYADKPVLKDDASSDGMHSSRQEKLAILATQPGTFILPAMDVTWWDITSHSRQTTTLPPRTFKVLPAPASQVQHTAPPQQPLQANNAAIEQSVINTQQQSGTWWKWLALISSIGWFCTLIWLFRISKKTHQTTPSRNTQSLDTSSLKRAVHQACREHQAKGCAQALLNFAKAQWPLENINNLNAMAQHCDTSLAQEIKLLEQHLYANQSQSTWKAESLQQAFDQAILSSTDKASAAKEKALPPLYPE